MKKTKIICTIGPASQNFDTMAQMALNGMDCARINLSHADEEDILKTIGIVKKVRKECRVPLAVMYDTKGPEFRTLKFKNGPVTLNEGDTIKMSKNCISGDETVFGVNHPEAIDFIKIKDKVLIDNALFELEVTDKSDDYVLLKALGKCTLDDNKTINVPGVNLDLKFISDADRHDIAFAATHSCDYIALSFVNTKNDVLEAREIIESAGGDVQVISKIESRRGVDNLDEIIDVSDGMMVARGDLGVEIPMEELPVVQKEIIKKCRAKGKFAIVATEMLASMYENPRPTRAEVSDVANAILDSTDCVMLSGETTIGKYPVESVEIMSKICKYIESTTDYSKHPRTDSFTTSDTIAKLVVDAVDFTDIKLIVTPTMTGFTAFKISNLRPDSIILACCPSGRVSRKTALNFGVRSVIMDIYDTSDEIIENARKIAKKEFLLKNGDLIIVTGGFPLGEARRTNYLRIVEV